MTGTILLNLTTPMKWITLITRMIHSIGIALKSRTIPMIGVIQVMILTILTIGIKPTLTC